MSFVKSKTFEERSYTIDFQNNNVEYAPLNFFIELFDVVGLWILLSTFYLFPLTIFLTIITLPFGFKYISIFSLMNILAIIYIMGYRYSNKKIWTQITMFLETPFYLFIYKKNKRIINLEGNKKVSIYSKGMIWKYTMLLFGESKKHIKTIEYIKSKICKTEKRLEIIFTHKVTGRIELNYHGKITRIIRA